MIRFICAFFALSVAFALPTMADSPVLVELFSSKNCKASAHAQETFRDNYAGHDDVLILTWPVDYWDYLGEDDPMALEASKSRQAAYVDRFKLRGPYTPQTVYNGSSQCPGSKPDKVSKAMNNAKAHAETGVSLHKNGDVIELTGSTSADAEVLLVTYLPGKDNTTGMINPVLGFDVLSKWSGGDAVFNASICPSACALIIQQVGQGTVLAAIDLAK